MKVTGMEVTDVLEKGKERLENEFCKDHNANRMANVIRDLEEKFGCDLGGIFVAYAGYIQAVYRYTKGR